MTSTKQSSSRQSTQSSDRLDVQGALEKIMDIDGAIGAAVVDYESGMTLGTIGGRDLDMELAGAGTTEVVRSKKNIIHDLGLEESIQDILVSLDTQYHLVKVCSHHSDLFIYLAIDREKGNLGLARRSLDKIDQNLQLD